MTTALAEVLLAAPSKVDLKSPQTAAYLTDLTALPLASILAEPTNLSSTSSQLTNALTNLCTSSYPTFLSLHSTTTGLSSTLSSFDSTLTSLLSDIPSLEDTARTFSSEIAGIQSERRRAALVLEHSAKLQDILELPLLADACVRNGYFQEALDLAAHAAALATRFPTVRVVQDVRAEVDGAVRTLLVQLLGILREPGKLPALFKAVSFLRRMHVLDEAELALAFLTGRLEVLDRTLQAVELEKKGIEGPRAKDAWVRYVKKYIDVWREGVHDVVTQYTTIFLERVPTGPGESPDTTALRGLIPKFTTHILARLLDTLRSALPHIPDPTALTSLLTQLTYCAAAFSRVGLDFRLLLPPLFSDAVRSGVAAEFHTATAEWQATLAKHADARRHPPSSWLGTAQLPREDALAGPSHTPPHVLAVYPPVATYANALLTALNGLRLLAPVALLPELARALDAELRTAAEALLGYVRTSVASGLDEEEKRVVKAVGTVFVRVFVPFIERALAQGVYGVDEGAAVGRSAELEGGVKEWEVWLEAVDNP
ncbi:Dor1-domain-containing protein [Auriscalpium vulgare]|uniref:Dor1-domain-containing protein n=1 Tax=Auriscalpium vulgare TaxID=40419 RepID=A0ACB8S0H1_9AGAM|nr:Dor1-domain-containing protein [Auriscalpium vulgare]